MMLDAFISFAWWNTGLFPPRKRQEPVGDKREKNAREVIRQLVEVESVDLLALGELAPTERKRLWEACLSSATRSRMVDVGEDTEGDRHISVLYNRAKLRLAQEPRALYDNFNGKRLFIGRHLHFLASTLDVDLHVFVVHWPSRIWGDAEVLRQRLGHSLQDRVRKLSEEIEPSPNVVVIGDFNDEPFNASLSNCLLGSRDRNLVRANRARLYNPFWRLLGERQLLEDEGDGRLGAGTHYYKSSLGDRWRTYDQFLVSGSLLSGSGLELKEGATQIWQKPPLLRPNGTLITGFDHFPIMGLLSSVTPVAAAQGA